MSDIFELCIIPLLAVLTGFLVTFIKAKRQEILANTSTKLTQEQFELLNKYSELAENTVINCVIATNQTYVDSLKLQGAFDKEAQEKAFNQTLEAVLSILSDDAKVYLTEAFGDLNVYLSNLIESQVNKNKIK